ncbi:MAG: small multi-drug export protein [bacterium]
MTYFDKWLAVILTTINPLTGRGMAIPLGIELGLPFVLVTVISALANFLMACVIILFIDQLQHIKWIKDYIEKKRGKRLTQFIQSKGLLYSVVFGPFVLGTFTVVLVFQALGADKKRMILYSLLSSIIVTPVIAWLSPLMVNIFNQYKRMLGF